MRGDPLDEVGPHDLAAVCVVQPFIHAQVAPLDKAIVVRRARLEQGDDLRLGLESPAGNGRHDGDGALRLGLEAAVALVDGAEAAGALVEDVEGDEVAWQRRVRHRVAREAPLAKEHLLLRHEELAQRPRVLGEPRVEPSELRVRRGAHVVRAVLHDDLVVCGERQAQVGAVYFLLGDHLVPAAHKAPHVVGRHAQVVARHTGATRVDHVVRARKLVQPRRRHLRGSGAPFAQQRVRLLKALDDDHLREALRRTRGHELLRHATHRRLPAAVAYRGVVGARRRACLARGGRGLEVDARGARATRQHREVTHARAVGRLGVAPVEDDAHAVVLAEPPHEVLDDAAAARLVL
eukprot:6446485-Prymnesium_polylepis.1